MRVTSATTNRNYLRNLNASASAMSTLNDQIASGRKFSRASEDTVSATKALLLRREYDRTQVYLDNAQSAKDTLTSVEGVLTQINSIAIDVRGLITSGINASNDPEARKIIANNIRNLAEEALKVANTEFSGKYVLAGSANGAPPFTKAADGSLLYNGAPVSQNNPATGLPYTNSELEAAFPMNKNVYVDIGIGIQISEDGKIDPNHALKISTSGVEVLGHGTDADGDPKNIYELFMKAADLMEQTNMDTSDVSRVLNKVIDSRDRLSLQIANIGDRSNGIDSNIKRLKNDDLNLTKSISRIESVNPESAIMDYKMQEFVYKATLQMGTKLIQPSIFDFMR